MHRFGWLLVGIGALMLLGKGFFFLPFLLWPLLLGMFLFRAFAHGPGWGYGHGRHGRHGYQGHGCGPRHPEREQRPADSGEPQSYTGETTRL